MQEYKGRDLENNDRKLYEARKIHFENEKKGKDVKC